MLNVSFLVPQHEAQLRRLRGEHRLQPAAPGRRTVRRWRPSASISAPYAEWLDAIAACAGTRAHARRRVHGAGVHHDGPRRQPDQRAFHPGAMDHSHRNQVPARWPAVHARRRLRRTAARACSLTRCSSLRRGIPVLFRPRPAAAADVRPERTCSALSNDRDGSPVNDYEGAAAARAHRRRDVTDARRAGRGAHRHARRAGQRDRDADGREIAIPAARAEAVKSTLPAAATPTGPG